MGKGYVFSLIEIMQNVESLRLMDQEDSIEFMKVSPWRRITNSEDYLLRRVFLLL